MEVKWTHVGQYKPYGDTYRVCEIHTQDALTEHQILSLVKHDGTPSKEQYEATKPHTMAEYFRGWYTIEKKPYGYLYTKQEPYDD